MKVWIAKYALTQGIFEIEATLCAEISTKMIREVGCKYSTLYHGNDWHETREAAIAQAEVMRKKKIASVKKLLLGLEALKFA